MNFKPPTRKEAVEYARSKGFLTFNYDKWYHFYNSKGWMIGKNKMKVWRSAICTWFCDTPEWREMKRKEAESLAERERAVATYEGYIKTASEIKLIEMRKAREWENLYWLIDELRPEILNKLKE